MATFKVSPGTADELSDFGFSVVETLPSVSRYPSWYCCRDCYGPVRFKRGDLRRVRVRAPSGFPRRFSRRLVHKAMHRSK